jgi:hypothetical protein
MIYRKDSQNDKMMTRNFMLCTYKNINTNENMSRPSKQTYIHYTKFDIGRCLCVEQIC